jgi:queuine tRNA-ribosyltransferase
MFQLLQTDGSSAARIGRLTLGHGVVDTPAFMAVGTQGTVKGMTPHEMRDLGVQILLSSWPHQACRQRLFRVMSRCACDSNSSR